MIQVPPPIPQKFVRCILQLYRLRIQKQLVCQDSLPQGLDFCLYSQRECLSIPKFESAVDFDIL